MGLVNAIGISIGMGVRRSHTSVIKLLIQVTTETTISFTDLTDVSVLSWEGTSAPTITGNTITFLADGTCWNVLLSDGNCVPYPSTGVVKYQDTGVFTDVFNDLYN